MGKEKNPEPILFLDSCILVLFFVPFHKIGNWKAKIWILRNLFGFEKLYRLIKYVIARNGSLKTIGTFLMVFVRLEDLIERE